MEINYIKELESISKKLRSVDGSLNSSERVALIGKIIKGYTTKPLSAIYLGVFRARKNENDKLFSKISELWYPPAEVTKIGRANCLNNPVFYCSENPNTAIVEMRPKDGDVITGIECKIKTSKIYPNVIPVGIYQLLKQRKDVPKFIFPKEISLRNSYIDSFLYNEFTSDLETNPEKLYINTSIISSRLLKEPFEGLAYPSVQFGTNFINFAFLPKAIDRYYKVNDIKLYYVHKGAFAVIGSAVILENDFLEWSVNEDAIDHIPGISMHNQNRLHDLHK